MRSKSILVSIVLLLSIAPMAQAECSRKDLRIVGHWNDTIGIFDKDGKLLREVPKAQLPLDTPVLDCNEKLGLVLVNLSTPAPPAAATAKPVVAKPDSPPPAPARPEWIDVTEVKLPEKAEQPCTTPATRAAQDRNSISPGVSGECEPQPTSTRKK